MGKAHAYGYTAAPVIRARGPRPRLSVMSGRNVAAVSAAARQLGFASWTADWRELVTSPAVDIVDICTPPGTHAEIIKAAAAGGKEVISGKPLAVWPPEAEAAVAAMERGGLLGAIGLNYRYLPALALMRELIASGEIGEVLLWRGSWLSDEFLDPATPFDWRFDRELGGSTVADLGSHLVDLAEGMAGPGTGGCAQSTPFPPPRPRPAGGHAAVTVDDASSALLEFGGGLRGTLEVAKTCPRRPCDFTVEVNGTDGTLVFDYARLNELRFGAAGDPDGLYGMRRIRAEEPGHPYAEHGWPIGQGVGYGASFVNQAGELLAAG